MVDFVLDDLRGKAREASFVPHKRCILVRNVNLSKPLAGTYANKRQAPFFCFEPIRCMHDLGIEHKLGRAIVVEHDDALPYANHVRGHTHAGICMRCQGIEQVLPNGNILLGSGFGRHAKQQLIAHYRFDHGCLHILTLFNW